MPNLDGFIGLLNIMCLFLNFLHIKITSSKFLLHIVLKMFTSSSLLVRG